MMVITQSQITERCWRRWYYKYQLGLDEFSPPLGDLPESIIIGRDVHAVMLGDEPQTDEARVIADVFRRMEFPMVVELESREVFLSKLYRGNYLLAGRADGLCIVDGEPAVYEVKTSKYLADDAYWDSKEMDIQLSLYCYLSGRRKVVLDFLRVPSISKNRWGSDWEDRVKADMLNRPHTYFRRLAVERTESEIEQMLEDIGLWVEMLELQLRVDRFMRQTKMCVLPGFTQCRYWRVCKGEVKPEQCQFRKPNEELEPELSAEIRRVYLSLIPF